MRRMIMDVIRNSSIVDAWQEAKAIIMERGASIADGNENLLEVLDLCIVLVDPVLDPAIDAIDPAMAAWMRGNFTERRPVPELGGAASYGTRLHDHGGVDQVAAVIEKLRAKPGSKSATISTLMVGRDTTYIPCVSLLDFKVRGGCLHVFVTARSLDFEAKALYNMVEITRLGATVQAAVNVPRLKITINVISAHLPAGDSP